jgi:outer membrane receptor for ferrienterochelin and colicins
MINLFTLNLQPRAASLLALLALFSTSHSFAQDSADPELAALMALLDEETELATQNKMNADFVPGTVSVLHGDELQDYGVTTVAEALNQVHHHQQRR